uniref:Uncharacterized protein n=1 Tax=Arundo donax TaxID=35708 RepID=A0A0A9BK39_ARUDO
MSLARAWDRCVAATATSAGFLRGDDGGGVMVYMAFSGVQAALLAAGSGAHAFAPVGLDGDTTRLMFAPLVDAKPEAAFQEPVTVQALALQRFLKLSGSLDFQVTDKFVENICLINI